MAIVDRSSRPRTEIENVLWAIKKADVVYDIELARVIASVHGVSPERIEILLGPQIIIIDPRFLKERNIFARKPGIIKKVLMYFNKRVFYSISLKKLIRLTGNDLILKQK